MKSCRYRQKVAGKSCVIALLCFFPAVHIGRMNIGVGCADIVLSVVADLIAGAVGVMRTIRLYPLGVLVYVVTVPVLST